jgi:hypothetical protein
MILAILLAFVLLVVGTFVLFVLMTAAGTLLGAGMAINQGTKARRQADAQAAEVAKKYELSPAEAKEVRNSFRRLAARTQVAEAREKAWQRRNRIPAGPAARHAASAARRPGTWTSIPDKPGVRSKDWARRWERPTPTTTEDTEA